MNTENIREILKSIGAEQVPAEIQKLARETSNDFTESLTQKEQPRRRVLLEYIMRSKLPKLAAAAVIVVAVLIGLNLTSKEGVAWAQLVEHVEKIQTVAYQMKMKMKGIAGMPEGKTVESTMEAKMVYDQGFAIDTVTRAEDENIETKTYVLFEEDAIVSVIPDKKKYIKMKLTGELLERLKKENGDPRTMLKQTMEYEYTELGRDTINGITVEGIEVTDPAMGQGMFDTIVARLWCDVKTDLPVLMTMKGSADNGAVVLDITLDDFNWDVDIDPAELEPNIPDDYDLLAETEVGGGKDGKELIETLKFFSEMSDGKVTQGEVWTFGAGSLVAWYKLDEGAGDAVADSGPGGIDGAAHGDPSWADGAFGKALVLDGKDAYVNLGNDPKFNITGQITVSAWIKVNAFDRNYQTIIAKGDTAWRLQRNAGTDTLEFGCMGLPVPNNPVWGGIYGKVSVNDGQWHHAAGTYDGEKISLYVDGALDVSVDAAGSIKTNDMEVYIGENSEKPGRFWNGMIDDVRVYSYALSASEIAAMASSR